jgi:hypothetical protein
MAQEGWPEWLAVNREIMLAAKTQYEWTFANRILARVADLTPEVVTVQQAFTDSEGNPRRMDFSVVEKGVRVAIEVDGFNKVPGTTTGMTSEQFTDFLRRQNSLTAQGWIVLRFANTDFTKNPGPCIRQIELALRQARASVGAAAPLTGTDADELARLRAESNDVESLREQLRKAEASRKRADTRARRAKEQAQQSESHRQAAEAQAQESARLRAEAEARARNHQIKRQRAEQVARSGAQRRKWLIAGITLSVAVACVVGVLYATRERLPGVSPASKTTCPADHPIKGNRSANGSQKIYHVPGGAFYDQTTPIRCFADEDEASSAGYRKSRR